MVYEVDEVDVLYHTENRIPRLKGGVIMPEKTPAQKRAQKAYMEKFARVEIRMTVEKQAAVKAQADSRGESVNTFISKAIDQAMIQDEDVETVSRRLAESRGIQTFESLRNEVRDACHLLTGTTWRNVFYNPQLYKSNEEREEIAAELVDGADRIHALFYRLAEDVRAGTNKKKSDSKQTRKP